MKSACSSRLEVVVRWGGDVVDLRRFEQARSLTVGTREADDVCAPVPSFALVSTRADGTIAVSSPDGRSSILDGDPVIVAAGPVDLVVRKSVRARRALGPVELDALWANTMTVTLFAMGALVAVLALLPARYTRDLSLDATRLAAVVTTVLPAHAQRARSLHERRAAPPTPKSVAARRHGGGVRAPREAEARELTARRTAMAATQAIADLVADAQGSARQLLAPAMWAGGMVSASDGAGGLALRSDASLGGATATIAAGGSLWARGVADFASSNSAGGDISAREDRDVAVVAQDDLTITGTLDREIIRRVVREHQAQVRYCYERALQRRRGLSGKLTAHFTIGAAGTVVAARADGGALGTDVASCVDAKVRGWRFPAPRGGGVVVVSYPFVLLPG